VVILGATAEHTVDVTKSKRKTAHFCAYLCMLQGPLMAENVADSNQCRTRQIHPISSNLFVVPWSMGPCSPSAAFISYKKCQNSRKKCVLPNVVQGPWIDCKNNL
jgi:hypothetical protein